MRRSIFPGKCMMQISDSFHTDSLCTETPCATSVIWPGDTASIPCIQQRPQHVPNRASRFSYTASPISTLRCLMFVSVKNSLETSPSVPYLGGDRVSGFHDPCDFQLIYKSKTQKGCFCPAKAPIIHTRNHRAPHTWSMTSCYFLWSFNYAKLRALFLTECE